MPQFDRVRFWRKAEIGGTSAIGPKRPFPMSICEVNRPPYLGLHRYWTTEVTQHLIPTSAHVARRVPVCLNVLQSGPKALDNACDARRTGATTRKGDMVETLRPATAADAGEGGCICFEAFASIRDAHNFPRDFPSPEIAAGLLGGLISHPGFYGVVGEQD